MCLYSTSDSDSDSDSTRKFHANGGVECFVQWMSDRLFPYFAISFGMEK